MPVPLSYCRQRFFLLQKRNKKGVTAALQLLQCFKWCRDQDSNQGHTDFQSVALPTELSRHRCLKVLNSLNQSCQSREICSDPPVFFALHPVTAANKKNGKLLNTQTNFQPKKEKKYQVNKKMSSIEMICGTLVIYAKIGRGKKMKKKGATAKKQRSAHK